MQDQGRIPVQALRVIPVLAPTVLARSLRTAFLLISCRRMSMSNFLQCWMYSWLPRACLLWGHRQQPHCTAPLHPLGTGWGKIPQLQPYANTLWLSTARVWLCFPCPQNISVGCCARKALRIYYCFSSFLCALHKAVASPAGSRHGGGWLKAWHRGLLQNGNGPH